MNAVELQDAIDHFETVVRLFLVIVFCFFSSKLQFDSYYKLPVALALDNIPTPGI
jgi:hypothetical protein